MGRKCGVVSIFVNLVVLFSQLLDFSVSTLTMQDLVVQEQAEQIAQLQQKVVTLHAKLQHLMR